MFNPVTVTFAAALLCLSLLVWTWRCLRRVRRSQAGARARAVSAAWIAVGTTVPLSLQLGVLGAFFLFLAVG